MPSKPAVTRKCQCFKIKPQLLSCQPPWRAFARARVEREGPREPRRAHSKLVLCTPLKARWVAHSMRQQPRRGLTLSGAISSEHPNHLSNISLYSFFSEWTESGNWASARPTAFGWTKDATKKEKSSMQHLKRDTMNFKALLMLPYKC